MSTTATTVIWPMGQPLHFSGQCKTTGCLHCSLCGIGPQTRLTYRYAAARTDALPRYECGLCPTCAGRAA